MIHLTLAIAAFMQMLAEAIFWVAARFAGWIALGGVMLLLPILAWRLLRRARGPAERAE